ncbi:cytochrome P450 [Streptosporangium soli]|nr:cytochrome P450 [Streptosporangium sp. KLBMP 9127]
MITRDADVRAGFLDPRFSLQAGRAVGAVRRRALDVTLVSYDPPHHTRIRRLATPSFAPYRIGSYRAAAETVASDLLEPLGRRQRFDLMAAFAHPFSFQVMCELFALAPAARPDLYAWAASAFTRPIRDRAAVTANLDRLDAYFRDEVGRRLADPGDDVLSSIVTGWEPGGEVSRDELVSLCATLLLAGYESTAQMIGMSVVELMARRELLAALHAHPAKMPQAVEELLRFNTPGPFGTVRTATEDVRVGDTLVPAGSRVLLSTGAANRDPARHRDPDLLDLDRPAVGNHLTFGLGPHYCLGAPLARLELTVALTAIVSRFPGLTPVTPLDRLSWRGNHLSRGLAELHVRPRGTGDHEY